MTILRHLHLPGITPYTHAARLQDHLVATFLAHKASPTTIPPPAPTILTAQFAPVYTCGRRDLHSVSATQEAHLRANGQASFHCALRGGQTTFHGPGQLVAYPILDLRAHGLNPRNYVCLLEKSVVEVCRRFGIAARTTANPGVWVSDQDKICALGVHLRRNVTSHGIGLNVGTDLEWFRRIVACGLEGKRTTSFEMQGVKGRSVEEVGEVFVEVMAGRLEGVEGVGRVTEGEVLAETVG